MNWVSKLKGLAAWAAVMAAPSEGPDSDILLEGRRKVEATSGLSRPLLLREAGRRSFISFQLFVLLLVVLVARERGRSGSRSTASSGGGWMRKGGLGDSMGPSEDKTSLDKREGRVLSG